jgi:hypothetical protein
VVAELSALVPSLPSLALCNGAGRRNVLKVPKLPLKLNGADKMTESGQGREEEGGAFVRDKWEPSWGFGALMCGAPRASSHLVVRPAVNNDSDDSRGEVTEESKNPTETLDSCNFSAVKMVNNASDDSRGEVTEESKNPTETLDSCNFSAVKIVNNDSDDSRGEVTEESKNPTETLDSCNFSAVKMQQPEKVTSPYDRYNPAAMFNAHRQADEEPDPSLRVTWSTFITEKEDDVGDDEQDE